MNNIQLQLFELIKESIPKNHSLVDEISELLGISYDSAYRRLRGEKLLTIEELRILSGHYKIPVDHLFGLDKSYVAFQTKNVNCEDFSFSEYLKFLLDDIQKIQQSNEKQIYYFAKDIPLFQHYNFKTLAAFKEFFWMKTIIMHPDYENRLFSADEINMESYLNGIELLKYYQTIPTIEIWNQETINSLVRQLEYYNDSGFFANPEIYFQLIEDIKGLINHVKKQAEMGSKFIAGKEAHPVPGNYRFYHSEVIIGDNTILVDAGQQLTAYLTYNVLDLMVTQDADFCTRIKKSLDILISKSNLLSSSSERERNKFFNSVLQKVERLVQ